MTQRRTASEAMTGATVLREYLAVPYLIEAETVERTPGQWVRRAAHPELPGCVAEAALIELALAGLERRRIEIVVALLRAGTLPPRPRPQLVDCDAEGAMQRAGLHGVFAGLLDQTAEQLAAGPS